MIDKNKKNDILCVKKWKELLLMKEKPLRKSARFISILLSIGCIIFGIMSVLLFAGIMVFVCAKLFFSEIFLEAWETAIKAGQTLSFGQCIFFFICVLGEFICIFLALSPLCIFYSASSSGPGSMVRSTLSIVEITFS